VSGLPAEGATATVVVEVDEALVDAFAKLSGDENALHMDSAYATAQGFQSRVAHGAILVNAVSTLIGMKLPGEGALWRRVRVDWTAPVFPGDTVTVEGTVRRSSAEQRSIEIALSAKNQTGREVMRGDAVVGLTDSAADEAAPVSERARARVATVGDARAVLVTGGSRGIGRAIALELAAAGFAVAVGYHSRADAADAVVAEIEGAGGRAVSAKLDVLDAGASAFDEIEAALGPLRGLVHGATPDLPSAPAADASVDELERLFRAYCSFGLLGAQRVLANAGDEKWGRVVFLGTTYITGVPPAKMLAYVTAKSALVGLTRALAAELSPAGVTVNLLSPGMVQTELVRHLSKRQLLGEAQRTPTRRLTEAADVAASVRYLFSDGGRQVTGAQLNLSGGLSMG
jgi:3-oxoacyl-[acyl-carrier protein] reductase